MSAITQPQRTRDTCKCGVFEPPAQTGATAIKLSGMKIWFNEFLQNAAFPAVVLAFACSLIKNEIPDVRMEGFTDHPRIAITKIRAIALDEEGSMRPADEKSCGIAEPAVIRNPSPGRIVVTNYVSIRSEAGAAQRRED